MVKQIRKRILAVIMTLALVISLMPAVTLPARAAYPDPYAATVGTPLSLSVLELCGLSTFGSDSYVQGYTQPKDDTETAGLYYGTEGDITYIASKDDISYDTAYDEDVIYFKATKSGNYTFDIHILNIDYGTPDIKRTITVNVTGGNTAPTVSGLPSDVTVTEDTAGNVDLSSAAFSDTDGDSLTVTLTASAGTFIASGDGSVTVDGSGTGTLTMAGSAAHINTFLDTATNISYTCALNASGDNAATFTVHAYDGTVNQSLGTVNIDITAVNDAPSLVATPSTPTFTEGGAAVALFSGTSVSTVESGQTITELKLTISNLSDGASEILNIDGSVISGASGTTATNGMSYAASISSGTATVTLTKVGGISTAAMAALVNGITYSNSSENPTAGGRVVTLTSITDNGLTANGGVDTTTLNSASTVTVAAVNDAPTVTTPDSASYFDTDANDSFNNTAGTLSASDIDGTIATYGISGGATGGSTDIGGTVYDVSEIGTYGTLYVKSDDGKYVLVPNAPAINAVTANQSETFTVSATDNGGASGNATITVSITGANDTPTDISLTSTSVSHSGGVDATVGTLTTMDRDVGQTYTYSKIAGDGTNDRDNASFNISGSTLLANNAASLAAGTYNVYIRTTDSGTGNLTFDKAFTITVTDNVAPAVTSVAVPANATYKAGQNLDFTVNFNEVVTVVTGGGTPSIALTIGATPRYAAYVSGSGTSALVFRYTVQAGDNDSDGIAVVALSANGGTVKDAALNNANLTLNNPGSTAAVLVDTTAPNAPTLAISADTGTNAFDGVTITAAQTITVSGEVGASVDLDFGDGTAHATSTIGAGGTFSAPLHTYAVGKYTISATLSDAVCNSSTAGTKVIVVDTTAPSATTPANQTISTTAATNGATVCALTATDATAITGFADTLTWSVTDGADAGKFSITGTNLLINNSGGLGAGSYTVQVTATDAAGNTNAKTITVGVVAGPTVGPVSHSYNDTTASNTFVNSSGNISANANSGSITGYGIDGGIADTTHAGYTLSKAGTYGTLYVNDSTGAYVYVPTSDALLNAQTATVTDVFSITATDGAGTAGNSFTITINGVNDAPGLEGAIGDQPVNDNATISPFTNVTITDVDTPNVTVTITVSDANLDPAANRGSLTGGSGTYNAATGVYTVSGTPAAVTANIRAIVFTPTANRMLPGDTETTKFNLRVDDGTWATSTGAASVIVTSINDAPTLSNLNISTSEDEAINGTITAHDVDVGASLTYSLIDNVSHGTLAFNENGTFSYTPAANFSGSDSFTCKANDGTADSGTATVTILTTAVNDLPTVSDSTKNGTEDTTLTFVATDFTDRFSDVEGTALSSVRIETLPANGTLKLGIGNISAGDVISAPNLGDIAFVPAANFSGDLSFTWKASDGTAYSVSAAEMTLSIANVDDAPTINTNNTLTIDEDAAATSIDTYLESSDVDSATITYTITTAPTKGTLTNDGTALALNGTFTQADIDGGKIKYTPSANLNGSDSFVFTVSDGTNSITNQTFNVTINPVNDAPVISSTDISITEGTTAAFTAAGSDPEGSAITWSITGGADQAEFNIAADGAVTFVTAPAFVTPTDADTNNSYVLQITASDGTLSVAKTVTVTVTQQPVYDDSPSTPAAPTPPASAVVEVNGQSQDAGTSNTQTIEGQTTTTITVDDTKLDNILESSGDKPTVTLPSTGSDVTVGELSGQTVKNMEQKEAVLEIRTETVSYTLPASQINIDAVSSQLGSQVDLKDIKVSVRIAEPSADTVKIVEDTANKNNYQILVKPVEFEITCTSGDNTVAVSRFNGFVERTVAIPDGIDPSKITTGIVLNADGTFSHVPTSIVMIGGKYFAKINSLTNSTYSVIYNPVTFTDVSSHWAKDSINDMGSRMVVTGTGAETYEPDRSITRAEFAAIVVRAMGLKKGTTESAFGDVTLTDWFNGYVDTATSYSLITGYDSASFAPNDTITREQAMTILARAMKLTGLSVTLTDSEASALLANYTDAGLVSDYAKAGAAACIKTGVVSGTTASTLSPTDSVTRAEVAAMVQRLLQKSGLI